MSLGHAAFIMAWPDFFSADEWYGALARLMAERAPA